MTKSRGLTVRKQALIKLNKKFDKLLDKEGLLSNGLAYTMGELRDTVMDNFADYVTYARDGSMLMTAEESDVIARHSHNKYADSANNQKWYLWKTANNTIGTYSVRIYPVVTRSSTKGTYTLSVHGPDVRFLEYGAGNIGQRESHPIANKVGWDYNKGPTIRPDEETGVQYWTYHGIARVGNPAGCFVYDAVHDSIENGELKKNLIKDIKVGIKSVGFVVKGK